MSMPDSPVPDLSQKSLQAIGTGLTLLFGILTLITAIPDPTKTNVYLIAALVISFLSTLGIYIWHESWKRWWNQQQQRPPLVLEQDHGYLDLESSDGSQATVRIRKRLHSNQETINSYEHRDLNFDGEFDGFTAEDPEMEIEVEGGAGSTKHLTIGFPRIGEDDEVDLRYYWECEGAFTAKKEHMTFKVDEPTRNAAITVDFPDGVGPVEEGYWTDQHVPGSPYDIPDPEYIPSENVLRWELEASDIGKEFLEVGKFEVNWVWDWDQSGPT